MIQWYNWNREVKTLVMDDEEKYNQLHSDGGSAPEWRDYVIKGIPAQGLLR